MIRNTSYHKEDVIASYFCQEQSIVMKPTIIHTFFLSCVIGIFLIPGVYADEQPVISIVYPGEKGDSSYIDSAALGIQRTIHDYPLKVKEYYRANSSEDPTLLDSVPSGDPDLVIVLGYQLSSIARTIADTHPSLPVIGIDTMNLTGSHTRTLRFSPYGASYLAGILAANQTQTKKIAVIAGMPDPNVDEFIAGFTEGAEKECPDVLVQTTYIANNTSGFADPERGGELTRSLAANGTDIIFPVAGGSGIGVIEGANNLSGLWIIGVDSDQSVLGPGVVLASVMKNVDKIVYREITGFINGSFSPGFEKEGISNGGSELRFNPRFENLSPVVSGRIDEAEAAEERYQR